MNAENLWDKTFLNCMEMAHCSPALGKATNWITILNQGKLIHTNLLRKHLHKNLGSFGPRKAPKYWKECMWALRVSEWTIGEPNLIDLDPLLFIPVQKRLWATCKTDKERSILSVKIANAVHPVKYKD
ncbi:hypothetical protein DSO57_1035006 [Entomophthora muscae]|uniref:Uncharacterized protein n=1 Tax=Entomophthora muscae TaxID=34485 RepID=A0ACC2TXR1_9FUNG|nr:hypothetical protein DSO57_1035006 [Entomophthora muscae]